jgi:hypothetical protein
LRNDKRCRYSIADRLARATATAQEYQLPHNPPLERTAAAVYFTCGRASRVRRRGRSTAYVRPT